MYYLYAATTLAALVALLPTEKDFYSTCEKEMGRLPQTRREIKGFSVRLRVSYIRMKIVRLFHKHKLVDGREFFYILDSLALQAALIGLTFLVPHKYRFRLMRKVVHHYLYLEQQSYVLCTINGTHECIGKMRELL